MVFHVAAQQSSTEHKLEQLMKMVAGLEATVRTVHHDVNQGVCRTGASARHKSGRLPGRCPHVPVSRRRSGAARDMQHWQVGKLNAGAFRRPTSATPSSIEARPAPSGAHVCRRKMAWQPYWTAVGGFPPWASAPRPSRTARVLHSSIRPSVTVRGPMQSRCRTGEHCPHNNVSAGGCGARYCNGEIPSLSNQSTGAQGELHVTNHRTQSCGTPVPCKPTRYLPYLIHCSV